MSKQPFVACALTLAVLSSGLALSADKPPLPEPVQIQGQEQIYGSQLMTQQERDEYRARMRSAKSGEEQEQIRLEHHELMKERAKAQGITLPDTPPPRGGGMMGPGGKGMGPGGGGMGGGRMGSGGRQ
jgi:hypothetical protein